MPHPACILPEPYRPPTLEQIERGRTMYVENFTVSRCLAATGMSLGTFYYWLDGGPREAAGQPLYPPIPRRRQVVRALAEFAREERAERHFRRGDQPFHGIPGAARRPRTTSWYS